MERDPAEGRDALKRRKLSPTGHPPDASDSTVSLPPQEAHLNNKLSDHKLLLDAIRQGDLTMVQTLVERGVDVEDGVQQGKMAPMIAACMLGRLEIAKYLFAHDARIIGVCFKRRFAPLHQACDHNHVEVVQWLVENGANIDDSCSGIGATPVAIAAMRGHLRIVKYLVSQGANTARPIPMRGTTLRYLCAWKGNLGMLKYLMESEIRCFEQGVGKRVDDAIKGAVHGGHVEIVQYLLSREKVDAQDVARCLHVAIEKKQLEIVDLLIEYGADVSETDVYDKTPLFYAVHSGLIDVVSVLLARGADVNQQASLNGYTAIHEMARCGHLGMLEAVARIKGPEVNFSVPSEREGELPLHLAAACGQTAVVRFLLQNLSVDVSINVFDHKSLDPLMHASQKGHLGVVQMLVEQSALVNNQLGSSTSLIEASRSGQLEVVQYLCENGADVNPSRRDGVTPVVAAAKHGHANVVEYLLGKHRADLCTISSTRTTALGEAVLHGFCDVARVLLSHNTHFLDVEENQSKMLCQALINNRADMVKLLMQSGVNVSASHSSSVNGEEIQVSPLIVAAGCGHLKLVKLLCENGAEVEATTERNESPLYIAVLLHHYDVVEYLVEKQHANVECAEAIHAYTPVEVASVMAAYGIEQYLLLNGAVPRRRESFLDFSIYDSLVTSPQRGLVPLSRREHERMDLLVRQRALEELLCQDPLRIFE